MKFKKDVKSSVHIRLPNRVRDAAREIAKRDTRTGAVVSEASVYTSIILSFFSSERQQNVVASNQETN